MNIDHRWIDATLAIAAGFVVGAALAWLARRMLTRGNRAGGLILLVGYAAGGAISAAVAAGAQRVCVLDNDGVTTLIPYSLLLTEPFEIRPSGTET